MSAFLVEDKTINRVVSYLWEHRKRLDLTEVGGLDKPSDRQKLAEAMYELNQQALVARYGKRDDIPAPVFSETTAAPIQVYKSLRCWLYQCSEGTIPEESLFFAAMEKIGGQIAERIVMSSREYDLAGWD